MLTYHLDPFLGARSIDEYGTVAWQYDDNGRPISAQSHKGYTCYYEYDAVGRRHQMIDPDARVSYFNYDDAGQLTQLLDGFSGETTWEYEPIGVPKKQVLPNTMVSYYAYDDVGQLTEVEHRKSDLTLLVSAEQSYDAASNIVKIVREDDGYTYYNYDGLNQLTEEIQKNSGGTQLYGFVWSYDGAGNRAHQDRDGALIYYSYDQANQLLRSITGAAWTYYQYDDNGNTIAEQITSGTTYYHYTPENRLSKVLSDIGGSVPNYFYYDGDQRRIITEDSGGRTYFLYDGEKVAVEQDKTGTTQAAYVNRGPSIYHPLIYMDRSGTKSYHLFNHLGTTLALASSAQALTDTYRWNAWGAELAATGSTTNPFAWVGKLGYYKDADRPLLSVGLRTYGPAWSRFLQRDPEGIAPYASSLLAWQYAYAAGQPLGLIDVTGQLSTGVLRGVGAVLGGSGYGAALCLAGPVGAEAAHALEWLGELGKLGRLENDQRDCFSTDRPQGQCPGAWSITVTETIPKGKERTFQCWHDPVDCEKAHETPKKKYRVCVRYARGDNWGPWHCTNLKWDEREKRSEKVTVNKGGGD